MKVAIFFALVAAAVAEPQFVFGTIPFTGNSFRSAAVPSTFVSGSATGFAPTFYSGNTGFQSNFIANPAGTTFVGNPITYTGANPITYSGAIPNTFSGVIPNTFSGVIPNTFSGVIPNTFSGVIPNTYSTGAITGFNSFPSAVTYSAAASPIVTSNFAASPVVYSGAPVAQVAAIVPKSIAQTKGSSHIVY